MTNEDPIEPRQTLSLQKIIAVGFGCAAVSRDGETVWQEYAGMEYSDCWSVARAEQEATADPCHDWRIHIVGPLHEGHWQRQAVGEWVLYAVGDGFA